MNDQKEIREMKIDIIDQAVRLVLSRGENQRASAQANLEHATQNFVYRLVEIATENAADKRKLAPLEQPKKNRGAV